MTTTIKASAMQRKLTGIRTLSIIAIALLSGMKTTGADFEFTLGGGLLASPDYKDLIDEDLEYHRLYLDHNWK